MAVPVPVTVTVGCEEELGRRVFSAREARRARRSGVRPRVFMPKRTELSISIDRFGMAALSELAAIARSASASRSGPFPRLGVGYG